MTNEKFNIREEIKVVPAWAVALAVMVFVAMPVFLLGYAFPHDKNPPPLPLQIFFCVFPGSLLGFFVLLIGYVNRDTKRREMNRALWTALVIFIPNGIGFILYFLLRHPRKWACPQCGALVGANFNFCPVCKFNLKLTCPVCKHEIRPGDHFCPTCAYDLTADRPGGGPPVGPATLPAGT